MYIKKLRLRGVGVFVDATIDLNLPSTRRDARAPSNVTLLVGDNAAGKTTVLRAIAIAGLAATGAIPTTVARSMVRRSNGSSPLAGRIDADVVRENGHEAHVGVDLRRPSASLEQRGSAAKSSFVVGYGATRDIGSSQSCAQAHVAAAYETVASLFEPHVAFAHPSAWLVRLASEDHARHADVVAILAGVAGPGAELVREPIGAASASAVLTTFSDGQRAHVAWIADVLRRACASLPRGAKIAEARGLVLVDQIEQHVHARWLGRLVPSIARALPRVQFVVSTHSPLVVGSVWRSNVVVLEASNADGADGTMIARPLREVFGLSVDQLLAMGVFGDTPPRNDAVAEEIRRTTRIARDGDADAALQALRLLSLGGGALGQRPAKRERAHKARAS